MIMKIIRLKEQEMSKENLGKPFRKPGER